MLGRVAIGVAVVSFLVGIAALPGNATTKKAPVCPPSSAPPRYPAIEPVFKRNCAGCHDSRKSKNVPAQRVFEMTSYPFATERPATLLHDLRGMFIGRGGLSDTERCIGIGWVDGGGLDASGNLPAWR